MRVIGLFCALAVVAVSTLFASGGPAASQDDFVAAGEKVFVKCRSCHVVGAPTKFVKSSPHLNDLFGRKPGSLPDKKYTEALAAFGQDKVWDEATLTHLLSRPARGGEGHQHGIRRPQD